MSKFELNDHKSFEEVDKELIDNKLFSLRFTDSIYKKDIGKFLEFLSSYLIWIIKLELFLLNKIINDVQIITLYFYLIKND